jgi:hypothetical protein
MTLSRDSTLIRFINVGANMTLSRDSTLIPNTLFDCAMGLASVGASRALATIEPSSITEVSMLDNLYDASAAGTFLVPRSASGCLSPSI